MADEIAQKYSNLRITVDEEEVVLFDSMSEDTSNSSLDLAIVGKVMTERPYNFEAFQRTMNQTWSI